MTVHRCNSQARCEHKTSDFYCELSIDCQYKQIATVQEQLAHEIITLAQAQRMLHDSARTRNIETQG